MAGTEATKIYFGDEDIAKGGADGDTFIRLASLSTRALITDFDSSEEVLVIEHESDTPPFVETQTVASVGVFMRFSDGSQIEFEGLTTVIDPSLISFVDTR